MAFHWSPLCDRQGKPSFAVFPRFSKPGQDGISKSIRDSGFFLIFLFFTSSLLFLSCFFLLLGIIANIITSSLAQSGSWLRLGNKPNKGIVHYPSIYYYKRQALSRPVRGWLETRCLRLSLCLLDCGFIIHGLRLAFPTGAETYLD